MSRYMDANDFWAARRAGSAPTQVLEDPGTEPEVLETPSLFSWSRNVPVGLSEDLLRIEALPRRPKFSPTAPGMDELVEEMTARYRAPGGTMRLRPIQAFTLREAEVTGRGVVSATPVGGGKTLISFLLPLALGVERAVLLVPASLRGKIFESEYPALAQHWRLPNLEGGWEFPGMKCWLSVVTYPELSRAQTADILTRKRPQALIADEGHRLKRRTAAQTKRAVRYLRANDCHFSALTGSFATRSITEMAGLLELALGEDRTPLPTDYRELQTWAGAVDVPRGGEVAKPGELARFCANGEDVREGMHRRLAETPGVVMTSDNTLPCSLNITARDLQLPKSVSDVLQKLRTEYADPDGFEFDTALELSRYARQVAAGVWLRRTWPRQEPLDLRMRWLEARNNWARKVRDYLASPHAREGMDSPMLLFQAAAIGKWRVGEFAPWAELKDECKPDSEEVWLDSFLVKDSVAWGLEHTGIIWYTHRAVGERIAELGGFPIYRDKEDGPGLRAEKGDRTVVVSANAHREGNNLIQFSRNLITTPSSNGQWWEQLLGRTHREGQPEDEVEVEVYVHTPEMLGAVRSAVEDAKFAESVNGSNQKLLTATFGFSLEEKSHP